MVPSTRPKKLAAQLHPLASEKIAADVRVATRETVTAKSSRSMKRKGKAVVVDTNPTG